MKPEPDSERQLIKILGSVLSTLIPYDKSLEEQDLKDCTPIPLSPGMIDRTIEQIRKLRNK